jgi:hypothetical protein
VTAEHKPAHHSNEHVLIKASRGAREDQECVQILFTVLELVGARGRFDVRYTRLNFLLFHGAASVCRPNPPNSDTVEYRGIEYAP